MHCSGTCPQFERCTPSNWISSCEKCNWKMPKYFHTLYGRTDACVCHVSNTFGWIYRSLKWTESSFLINVGKRLKINNSRNSLTSATPPRGNFITKHKDASNVSNYNLKGNPTTDAAAIHQSFGLWVCGWRIPPSPNLQIQALEMQVDFKLKIAI